MADMHSAEMALDEALVARLTEELLSQPAVVGAIWVGSRARGAGIGPSSDIDIIAVIDESAGPKWRRGFRDRETGRHVELLFRPPSLDRLRFRECAASGESWPHGYVTGGVLFDRNGTLALLIAEARALWDAGPEPMSAGDREWERYEMWQQRLDIADRVASDPDTSAHLLAMLINRLVRFLYRLERRWYPPDKYLLRDLDDHNPVLAATVRRAYATGATAAQRLTSLDEVFATLASRHEIQFDAPYSTARA